MKNLFKTGFSRYTKVFMVVVMALALLTFGQQAYATLTLAVATISSDGALTFTTAGNLTINGVGASVYTIGAATTTGTITIGGTAQTGSTTIRSSTVSGTTTTSGIVFSADAVADGTAMYLTADGLTTGQGLLLDHTTSVIADGGSLLRLSSTSIDTGGATNGTLLDVISTAQLAGTLVKVASIATTGTVANITSTGIMTGAGNLLTLTGNSATTAAGLLRINGNGLTSGIGEVITSSATAITGAGRLFMSNHTGATGTSATLNEFKTAAADETILLGLTAESLTTGTLLDFGATAALTTGTAMKIAHTTSVIAAGGSLARISSSAIDTSTTTGVLLDLASTASLAGTQFLQTYSALTTGIGQSIVADALTTGTALDITNASGVMTTNGEMVNVSAAAATTSTGVVRITAAGLTSGSALAVIGSAPATMTVAGSIIRASDGTNDVFRIGWNGHLTSTQTTAPTGSTGTCTVDSVDAAATDTKGVLTATCNNQTAIVAFNKAYAAAPTCVVTPMNAAATANIATMSYVTATTGITITQTGNVGPEIWAYVCVE